MKKNQLFLPLIVWAASVQFAAHAQPVTPPMPTPEVSALTVKEAASLAGKDLEVWLASQLATVEEIRQQPNARLNSVDQQLIGVQQLVLQRLQSGVFVSDEALLNLIQTKAHLEEARAQTGVKTGDTQTPAPISYEQTQLLVGEIVENVNSRPLLEAKMHIQRAHLFENSQSEGSALEEYKTAISLLDSVRLDADTVRLSALVRSGGLALRAGETKQAEALYLEALSYDWYKVKSPKPFQALKDLYIQAGLGLIDARRGNLRSLKEIVFVPSVKKELGPPLQAAIKQAEKGG